MASAFAHALTAVTVGKLYSGKPQPPKFWLLGIFCSVIPDADVLAFKFGIPYGHMFGHRGFTHSFFFAAVLALLLVLLFFRKDFLTSDQPIRQIDENDVLDTGARMTSGSSRLKLFGVWLYLFICSASHNILDAMTTGGKGIAFWAPFSDERVWLPWRVIRVSPIRASDFFSEWGVRVLKSEFYWVGLPCIVILVCLFVGRKLMKAYR